MDGHAPQDVWGTPVEFLEGALGFGNVRTLILSRRAVRQCLFALDRSSGPGGNSRWFFPINTLIIYPGPDPDARPHGLYHTVLLLLLSIAQKRKTAGFPFKSVLLFLKLRGGLEWDCDHVLGDLKGRVEKLEVVTGDGVLDWDVDKYFLDGLEHLQNDRDVQWD